MMRRPLILLVALPLIKGPLWASDPTRPEDNALELDNPSQESESSGIIPEGA